ncbi:MAG: metallophosphoesterase [Candidatus Helarchaeales archaeon]
MASSELNDLLDPEEPLKVSSVFEREPILIELESVRRVLIIGDTHGDFKVSKHVLDKYLDVKDLKIVFLGDYVDRGPFQIQNINFLFKMKQEFPDKLILLRGNHEWREMNLNYGFNLVLSSHFRGDDSIHDRYVNVFSQMPIAVRIKKPNVILLHGGIPLVPRGDGVVLLDEIRQIPKGITEFWENDVLDQIQWNDPKEYVNTFEPSARGIGYYFGKEVFKEFMTANEIDYCVRSHEPFPRPKFFFDKKLVSIFSSITYGIEPQFLLIDEDARMQFMTM